MLRPQQRPAPAHVADHGAEGGGHGGEAHCPGHGPHDVPHFDKINWWHGMIGVNNEKAGQGGLNSLLWRYENHTNPCDEKNEPPPFFAAILNLGVLGFLIYRFGKKPISEALLKRKQTIMGDIDTASNLRQQAEKRLREYEARFEQMEETAEALRAEYAAQAQLEKKHVLAEAEERRTRMRRDAEFRIEQELRAARIELLREAVQNATAAAEDMIRKGSAQADNDRMAEDYIAAVRGAYAPQASAPTTGGRS
jgi:F-type H+-transporting ATPase subunit b